MKSALTHLVRSARSPPRSSPRWRSCSPCGRRGGGLRRRRRAVSRPASVDERGEIALADGRLLRLAGLDLPAAVARRPGAGGGGARVAGQASCRPRRRADPVFRLARPLGARPRRSLRRLADGDRPGPPPRRCSPPAWRGFVRNTRRAAARRRVWPWNPRRAQKRLASGAIPIMPCSPPTTPPPWRDATGASSSSKA